MIQQFILLWTWIRMWVVKFANDEEAGVFMPEDHYYDPQVDDYVPLKKEGG